MPDDKVITDSKPKAKGSKRRSRNEKIYESGLVPAPHQKLLNGMKIALSGDTKGEMIRTPELVPEGIYELEIDSVNEGIAQNGQSYRIIVNFHISRGEYETYEIKAVFTVYNPENFQSQRISRMLFRNLLFSCGVK